MSKGPHIITVEAAIACGKSTFLGLLESNFGDRIKVVTEPLEMWQNVDQVPSATSIPPAQAGKSTGSSSTPSGAGTQSVKRQASEGGSERQPSESAPPKLEQEQKRRKLVMTPSEVFVKEASKNFNALDLFYKNSRRFAYAFQGYVFMTRVRQIEQVVAQLEAEGRLDDTLIVCERSWITDAETFVRLLAEDEIMSEIEYRMFRQWHSWLVPKAPRIGGLVYLNASLDCVMKRVKLRNRSEESTLDVGYQRKLIQKHDQFFKTPLTDHKARIGLSLSGIAEDPKELDSDAHAEADPNRPQEKARRLNNFDFSVSADGTIFHIPTLVLNADIDFQSNSERLQEIFDVLHNFLISPLDENGKAADPIFPLGLYGEATDPVLPRGPNGGM